MTKQPTIIEVAKAAGLSKSTVLPVPQNGARVWHAAAMPVRNAAADLGYAYNGATASSSVHYIARQTASAMLDWLEDGQQPVAEARAGVELIVRASSAGFWA